jgi:hypothetical protein
MIQTMHIGDFKSRFSEVVELIKKGITIKVIKGKSGDVVGYFGKNIPPSEKTKRRLGFLAENGIDIKKEDLQWSKEELEEIGF